VAIIPKENFKFKAATHAPKLSINTFYVANEQGNQRFVKPDLDKALLEAIRGRALDKNMEVYAPRKYQIIRQGLRNEVVKVGPAALYGSDVDIRPPSVLKLNPATIWYTLGSKQTSEGSDRVGAGVYNDKDNIRVKMDPSGEAATNTITRAELVAILVTLQQIEKQSYRRNDSN